MTDGGGYTNALIAKLLYQETYMRAKYNIFI